MKLGNSYAFGLVGLVFLSFGSGMLFLSMMLGIPAISTINASALLLTGVGFAIVIKMLSTIRRVEIVVEDEE